MTTTEIKKGTKITPEEVQSLDPSTFTVATAETPEVEGQEWYPALVECPWCETILRVELSTDIATVITCGNCGQHFRR